MAVFSRLPIDFKHARTFQHFLGKDMPGALLPGDPATPAPHGPSFASSESSTRRCCPTATASVLGPPTGGRRPDDRPPTLSTGGRKFAGMRRTLAA
jgi:hypothetical protein